MTIHPLDRSLVSSIGFTLVELLVVIALTSVVAVMAIPYPLELMKSHYLTSSTTDLRFYMSSAQSQAMRDKSVVSLNLNSSGEATFTEKHWLPMSTITTSPSTPGVIYFGANGYPQVSATDPTPISRVSIELCQNMAGVKTSKVVVLDQTLIEISQEVANGCSF